jgi:hypothetical protein
MRFGACLCLTKFALARGSSAVGPKFGVVMYGTPGATMPDHTDLLSGHQQRSDRKFVSLVHNTGIGGEGVKRMFFRNISAQVSIVAGFRLG